MTLPLIVLLPLLAALGLTFVPRNYRFVMRLAKSQRIFFLCVFAPLRWMKIPTP